MTGLPNPTYLGAPLLSNDQEMCLMTEYDEVCALVREPSHVYATLGEETVLITGCLSDGKVSILRGVDGTPVAGSLPKGTPLCFVKAITAPVCERLLPTGCNKCTCGCCDEET